MGSIYNPSFTVPAPDPGPVTDSRLPQFDANGFPFVTDVSKPESFYVGKNKRTTPVRLAYFGDSTANLGAASSPDNHDTRTVTAPFPAAGATVIGFGENAKASLTFFYPNSRVVFNGGISGDTTTGMLARDNAVPSVTRKAITDALTVSPDVFIYHGASINDISGVTPANWESVADAVYVRHLALLARMLSGCPYVIDSGVFGYSGGAANHDQVRLALLRINANLRANIPALFDGRVLFADPLNVLHSPDGNFLPGVSFDGIHLGTTGGLIWGRVESALLVSLFGESTGPVFPGVNLVSNPTMSATTVVGYGTIATGYPCTGVSAVLSGAAVETLNGKPFQTVNAAVSAVSSQVVQYMPIPMAASGLLLGDDVGFEFDFYIQLLGGFNPTVRFLPRVDMYKSGAGRVVLESFTNTPGLLGATEMFGKACFYPFKMSEPGAILTASTVFQMTFAITDPAGVGSVKTGVSSARIVKLN